MEKKAAAIPNPALTGKKKKGEKKILARSHAAHQSAQNVKSPALVRTAPCQETAKKGLTSIPWQEAESVKAGRIVTSTDHVV